MCLHKNCSLPIASQKKTLSWSIMRVRRTYNVSRKEWSWKHKCITLCYQYSCWVLTGVQLTWSFCQFKSKLWQQSYILKLTWSQQCSVVTRSWPSSSPSLSAGFLYHGSAWRPDLSCPHPWHEAANSPVLEAIPNDLLQCVVSCLWSWMHALWCITTYTYIPVHCSVAVSSSGKLMTSTQHKDE